MKVLIIIPAFNEAKNLPELFDRLRTSCPDYDLLVVNDSSGDDTINVCRAKGVDVLDLPVNLGIGGAVQAGYRYAMYNGYDAAVQVDGDGQHDPAYIEKLVEKVKSGVNLCIGSRFLEKEGFQSTFMRRVGIRFFSDLIYCITRKRIKDPTSGFRACDRRLVEFFATDYPGDYPEPETLVTAIRNNFSIEEIPVVMKERSEGKSSITSIKSVYYMIKVSLAIIAAAISKRQTAY